MITDDDEDEKIEVSLGAYRSGKLSYEKVMELSSRACDDYGLDTICRSYFFDSPIEMRIAVLASLTSVPPGLRANENTFVKTSFQNMALHPPLGGARAPGKKIVRDEDAMFADISSLSSSLMAMKTSDNESRERSTLSTTSNPDSLRVGKEASPPSQSFPYAPVRILKHPPVGPVVTEFPSTADEQSEEVSLLAAQQERAQFPIEFIDKLIAVLKRCGPEGLLGSQFPEVYRKMHGEKLVLENKKGRKLKLIHVLDGHPNVRKEKLGTYKWYYKEASASSLGASVSLGYNQPLGVTAPGVKVKEPKAVKTKVAKGSITAPYSGPSGIEVDLLPADSFPCVAWLRDHDMHMYRWAGNAKEWTEYAMRLRPEVALALEVPGDNLLSNLRRQSGCVVSVGSDMLNGRTEKFLVFVRGDSGQPSNGAMTLALEVFSNQLREELGSPGIDTLDFEDEEDGRHLGEGRVQKVMEIPQAVVGLIAGKAGKKLYAMRKKSGAYIALISKNKIKGMAKLTVSGTQIAVDNALSLVKLALSEYDGDDQTL
jgi:hypothetical protein